MPTIDLNADVGEGFDDGLLEVVTSANVACGFHAGDPATMRRVCDRAAERAVTVGAHVSYRDREGFGRRRLEVPAGDLRDDVLYQLGGLSAMASVRYVKAHGALYNRAADERETAEVIAAAVAGFDPGLALLCLPGSTQAEAAEAAGLTTVGEGYLDRGYDGRGRLVPRGTPGALLEEPAEVVARAVALATSGVVRSIEGNDVAVCVRSLCTHGDTPAALDLARAARAGLEDAGVEVRSFVSAG